MREVSGSQLSDLTGRSWRTVKALLEAAGIRPLRREGRADLFDSELALRAIYAPSDPSEEFDGDQRQRLAAAQAEKVEHENAVRRGELADMRDVEKAWTDFVANARAKALGMHAKLSPRLVNIGDASIIAAAIRAEVYAFLAELAEYRPEPGRPGGDDPPDLEDMGSSAGANRKRMGRQIPAPVKRKRGRAGPVADR